MPPEAPPLPPKPEVALALLQSTPSLYVHLDPRDESVAVPPWFKKQPQLVLQIGLNMAVPIPDLDIGNEAITCTLSFNRRPEFCRIPWEAIYGLVGEDGRGMIWPESVPPEVAAAAEGRAMTAAPAPTKSARGHLRLASSRDEASEVDVAVEDTAAEESPVEQAAVERVSLDEVPVEPESASPAEPEALADRAASGDARKRELPPYLRVVK